MIYVAEWRCPGDYDSSSRSARPQRLMGGAALVCIAFACSWTLMSNLIGPSAGPIDFSGTVPDRVARGDRLDAGRVASRGDKLTARTASLAPAANNDALLFDPRFAMGTSAAGFADDAAAPTAGRAVASAAPQSPVRTTQPRNPAVQNAAIPIPPVAPQTRTAALRDDAHRAVAKAVADTRSIFEKLFGRPASPPTLAYADADTGTLGGGRNITAGLYDRETAVYDISAHVVYLPDGTKLEAHSGLGSDLDDPHSVAERDRGVTPATVYDLEPREALFHGVPALRLIPQDDSKVFGRSGLLAHSFMLGPNGDSNGCVSFRDYEAFLQAYRNNEIKRLAVVTRLD